MTHKLKLLSDELERLRDTPRLWPMLAAIARAARAAAGMTHQAVADDVGMSRDTIARLESGERYSRWSTVLAVFRVYLNRGVAFEVDVDAGRYAVHLHGVVADGDKVAA